VSVTSWISFRQSGIIASPFASVAHSNLDQSQVEFATDDAKCQPYGEDNQAEYFADLAGWHEVFPLGLCVWRGTGMESRSAFLLCRLARSTSDLFAQRSASRPSDVTGFAAALAKIVL